MVKKKPTLDKYRAVVRAYFKNGFNQEQAMLTAGYAPKTARHSPHHVFGRDDVKLMIEREKYRLAKKFDLDQDWVIRRYMKLADAGDTLAKFKKIDDDGQLFWDFSGANEEELALIMELSTDTYQNGRGDAAVDIKKFRVRIPDPEKALNALARHLGLFNDKLEVTGDVTDALNRGRQRAHAKNNETDPDTVH
jgi:phage terminase small subunit